MPNRIIKESICTSETIDRLSPFQETAFVRLIVNCDDFGRFFGNPKIVSSRLYPLRDVTPEEMENALETLRNVGLIPRYVVDGKPYIQVNTWAEHQQTRAAKSKYPAVGDGQIQPVPGNCNQMISNDIKCSRYSYSINDNRNTITETGTEPAAAVNPDVGFITDEDAQQIQSEHNRVLDAAEDAGFQKSNSVRAGLLKLYEENGLEKVLNGIKSCVEHGAVNLAYLRACMKDNPKRRQRSGRILPAQDFEQRDYSGVQEELEREQAERIKQRAVELGAWDAEKNRIDAEKFDAAERAEQEEKAIAAERERLAREQEKKAARDKAEVEKRKAEALKTCDRCRDKDHCLKRPTFEKKGGCQTFTPQ